MTVFDYNIDILYWHNIDIVSTVINQQSSMLSPAIIVNLLIGVMSGWKKLSKFTITTHLVFGDVHLLHREDQP